MIIIHYGNDMAASYEAQLSVKLLNSIQNTTLRSQTEILD